jgi:hypothetical protein
MGVSSRQKEPVNPVQIDIAPCRNTAAERFGSRLLGVLTGRSKSGNQALALLSAVRSERSA